MHSVFLITMFHVKFKACSSLADRFLVGSYNQKQYNWNMSICSDPSFQTQQKEQTCIFPILYFEKSKLSSSCNCLADLISDGSHAVFHRSQRFQILLSDE